MEQTFAGICSIVGLSEVPSAVASNIRAWPEEEGACKKEER